MAFSFIHCSIYSSIPDLQLYNSESLICSSHRIINSLTSKLYDSAGSFTTICLTPPSPPVRIKYPKRNSAKCNGGTYQNCASCTITHDRRRCSTHCSFENWMLSWDIDIKFKMCFHRLSREIESQSMMEHTHTDQLTGRREVISRILLSKWKVCW